MRNIPFVLLHLISPGRFPVVTGRRRIRRKENPYVHHSPQLWHLRYDIHARLGGGARIWIELRELVNELLRLD